MTGAQKLSITDSIFELIHDIAIAGIRDALGPRATNQMVKKELTRRLSL